jgi:hypothetical protein
LPRLSAANYTFLRGACNAGENESIVAYLGVFEMQIREMHLGPVMTAILQQSGILATSDGLPHTPAIHHVMALLRKVAGQKKEELEVFVSYI